MTDEVNKLLEQLARKHGLVWMLGVYSGGPSPNAMAALRECWEMAQREQGKEKS